ncbi:MAG: hypothetical protein ACD_58C00010G0013 [uncultured bacterium]|nr:MAG: hypothetical protein ACD_58C00010G0013 [uncultured bacterium]
MNYRKQPLVNEGIYHILNKSIAEYKIFSNNFHFRRMMQLLVYYQYANVPVRYSYFIKLDPQEQDEVFRYLQIKNDKLVDIISYCLMPTHYHLILKQLLKGGISKYINLIQNSYAKYFNIKHDRNGPLWQGYFKNVLVDTDEQLLHLTRYQHINPVSAGLVEDPIEWEYSSYKEYIGKKQTKICSYNNLIDVRPKIYKRFVENRISYQRELTRIKKIILE